MNDRSENDLIRRLEMLGAVQPSPEATHRAVSRVRQALAGAPPILKLRFTRRILVRRLSAAAAVVLVAGSLSAWWLLPMHSTARADFAAVQAAMKSPATLTCRQTTTINGMAKESRLSLKDGVWRENASDGRFTLTDAANGRTLSVNPQKRDATLVQGRNPDHVNLYETVRDLPGSVKPVVMQDELANGQDALIFTVRANAQDITVRADPETGLPRQIESQSTDDAGNLVAFVLDEFEFGKPLDGGGFAFVAPDDFKLIVKGVPFAELVATPLEGLKPLKFGMSREDVETIFGPPDAIKELEVNDRGVVALSYASHGFAITLSRKRGVESISCFAQPAGASAKVRGFDGKTDKGLATGTHAAEIVEAYGEPDSKQTINGLTRLRYAGLQAEFTLSSNDELVLLQIWLKRQ
jgi:hypothetical protein